MFLSFVPYVHDCVDVFRRLVSACMSLHCWVHPDLELEDGHLMSVDSSNASLINAATSLTY